MQLPQNLPAIRAHYKDVSPTDIARDGKMFANLSYNDASGHNVYIFAQFLALFLLFLYTYTYCLYFVLLNYFY